MLTWPEIEVVAFEEEWGAGEPYCRKCAVKEWSALLVAKAEARRTERLVALSRYQIESEAIEAGWVRAKWRIRRFMIEHPSVSFTKERLHSMTMQLAFSIGVPDCEGCGAKLTVSPFGISRREKAQAASGR